MTDKKKVRLGLLEKNVISYVCGGGTIGFIVTRFLFYATISAVLKW